MAHTYEELKSMTVAQLREVAKDTGEIRGYSSMNKDHLLHELCKALGLEEHVVHEVKGIDKASVKARIRELKAERDKLLEARDRVRLKRVRRRIHRLKRRIHKATV
jgi:Rho termination factor, N-terminal domain